MLPGEERDEQALTPEASKLIALLESEMPLKKSMWGCG